MNEYTVELMRQNGDWVKQVDVFGSYEEAEYYCDNNRVDEDKYYYSIWCIEYDEDGEEIASYPVY